MIIYYNFIFLFTVFHRLRRLRLESESSSKLRPAHRTPGQGQVREHIMKLMLVVLSLSAVLHSADARLSSSFNKPIDLDALDKEFANGDEPEDEDWHEDTYEWKEKMNEKLSKPFDPSMMPKKGEEVLDMQAMMGNVGGMKMTFITLRKRAVNGGHWCASEPREKRMEEERMEKGASLCGMEQATALSRRWQHMLMTDGYDTRMSVLGAYELLAIDDDGRRLTELKAYMLAQPETMSFRFDNVDYHPDGVVPAPPLTHPPKKYMKVKPGDPHYPTRKKKKKKKKKKRRMKKKKKKTKRRKKTQAENDDL